ncbi:MAG: Hsp20/alpha crystallin family protein [Clostridiales bacterium]|nr:Hsp20/alpha crystallin family protein [Clostridiales bacterium]
MFTMIPYRRNRNLSPARQMSNFLNDSFFRSFFDMSDMVGNAGFRVDIKELDNQYVIEAELPGVKEDQINLTVNDDVLKISATMNQEADEQQGAYCYRERRCGHMERSFTLEGICQDDIKAEYSNGVLTVNLPKLQQEPQKAERRIAIAGIPATEETKADD